MAARHLQKLRLQDPAVDAEEAEASEGEEEAAAPSNPFDLLDDLEVR